MKYPIEIQEYIKHQEKRPDWNRNKLGWYGIQWDKLSDGTYILYDYENKKVIDYGFDVCKALKTNRSNLIVEVWKDDKVNFFVPKFDKDKLALSQWADTYSPQCSMGNKYTLCYGKDRFRVNFDKSLEIVKGSYNMWTIEKDED